MSQLSLFGPTGPSAPAPVRTVAPSRPSSAHVPRWYQDECLAAIQRSHQRVDTTLALLATGLGKSVIASTLVNRVFRAGGSALVMAHRNELVTQMAKHLERATGEYVEVEQAELRVSSKARLVVASTPSLSQVRLDRLGAKRFDLVIADEFHHYLSPSFRNAWEFFKCKKLGITATADRTDEAALAQICEDVAYTFDILDGIDAGYLVPVLGESVRLQEIDLSEVRSNAKDLVAAQLDEVMLKAGAGLVHKVLEMAAGRRGILFLPGVKSAEYVAERLNTLAPALGCGFVSGDDSWAPGITRETHPDKDQRRAAVLALAKSGRCRYLANCAVLTEGFDWPDADLVAMGRPTLSRQLYVQCTGRGTRVLPGVVDSIHGKELATARRAAIAASGKPNMLLLDFGGNAGRHSLIGPEDVLGGNFTEVEVEEAKKSRKAGGGDIRAALEQARRTLKAAAELEAKRVQAKVQSFNPFQVLAPDDDSISRYERRFGRQQLSVKQFELLTREGWRPEDAQSLSKKEASRAIEEMFAREKKRLASVAQLRALAQHGIVDATITKDQAIRALAYIDRNRRRLDVAKVWEVIRER